MPLSPRAPRRPLAALVPFTLLAALAFPCVAYAQTANDADRAAARELFIDGVKLQEAGNFADALDRFTRAQSVFSAPTHLLHIAECEAALGKLVESAETYRTLTRTPLPPGAPNAFVQAQQQGAAELPQVEPRIPSIRLFVRPANLPSLTILVDGQAMSSALVGVQRPTDPGTHTVSVSAPGYMRSEQRVILHEKENKDVTANLPPANGITYAPPPVAPPVSAPPGAPPPPPPMYGAPPEAEGRPPAKGGFMLGATVGGLIPGGNLQQGTPINNAAGSGPGIAVSGGFRFVKRLYLGLTYEHGFLSSGNAVAVAGNNPAAASQNVTANASSDYVGLDFAYISNPDGVAFFGEVGAGFRVLTTDVQIANVQDSPNTLTGGELSLGVGLHIKIGDWIRLIPRASVSAGQFSNQSSGSITSTDTHSFVLIGVTAFVDFARKH